MELDEFLLDVPRESGDGDSGAECKEPTGSSPLAPRKDFLEIKDALVNITREVQGAERPKDNKKLSRIPVRQVRPTSILSSIPQNPASDINEGSPNTTSSDKNNVSTLSSSSSSIHSENQTIDSLHNSAKREEGHEREKWRDIKQLVQDEEYSLLEEAYLSNTPTPTDEDCSMNSSIIKDFNDIHKDLIVSRNIGFNNTSNYETSTEDSLSPRAPIAHIDGMDGILDDESPTSEDFTLVEETILEAPEEFRSSEFCGDQEPEMPDSDVWTREETDLSTTALSCTAEDLNRDRGAEVGLKGQGNVQEWRQDTQYIQNNKQQELAVIKECASELEVDVEDGNTIITATNQVEREAKVQDEEKEDCSENVTPTETHDSEIVSNRSDNEVVCNEVDNESKLNAEQCVLKKAERFSAGDAGARLAMNGRVEASYSENACAAHRTLEAAAVAAVAVVQASIASSDAAGAQATRSSRVSTVSVRAASRFPVPSHAGDTSQHQQQELPPQTEPRASGLDWEFRDGRLVFVSKSKSNKSSDHGETASELPNNSNRITNTENIINSACENEINSSNCDTQAESLFEVLSSTCTQQIEQHKIVNCVNDTTEQHTLADCIDEPDFASLETSEPLRSRDINRRSTEIGSRLKLLESKLKEAAGLTDTLNTVKTNNKSAGLALTEANNKLLNSELKESVNKGIKEEEVKVEKEDTEVVLDKNENECGKSDEVERKAQVRVPESEDDEDLYPQIEITELGSPADLDAFLDDRFGGRCEFDVRRIGAFTHLGADGQFFLVYDELEDECCSSESDEPYGSVSGVADSSAAEAASATMRGDGGGGGGGGGGSEAEPARKRHNPDHDNLKSLLKKPGRGKDKKNRVSFNENRNEFFDADYIILIREECDYDEDDDDGVCTCNQHEMVRLTCCEPGCNCGYDEGPQVSGGGMGASGPTPQSPKFAPPLEFVDSVTLSPPEGYKDMDLGEQQLIALQQMARLRQQQQQQPPQQHQPAVCRECSGVHESDSNSGSDTEEQYMEKPQERISEEKYQQSQSSGDPTQDEREKTDQSQQTTPTTPPADCAALQPRYIMETITMTTVTERRLVREVEDTSPLDTSPSPSIQSGGSAGVGSPISGILKGGKLWKQQSGADTPVPVGTPLNKASENLQSSDASNSVTSDEEGNTLTRRSVRFHESDAGKRDSCDGEADKGVSPEEADKKSLDASCSQEDEDNQNQKEIDSCNNSVSPDATEMMLTFKLGHHVLISNNSLRPNSAVRQLFPCSKPVAGHTEGDGNVQQYLVTAESLRAFEEAKRSKLPHIMQGESDDTIRKTIERNTLRRSLIRYEPRSKKHVQKTDNSLVERIKQLTCDVDEPPPEDDIPPRGSPPGEESSKDTINQLNNRNHDKSFSPSSSSTTSSNSSMSSTYKKITDLFNKREKIASDAQNNAINESNNKQSLLQTAPDLGNGGTEFIETSQCSVAKIAATNEARKQFLSTLAPLTACVTSNAVGEDYQYQYQLATINAGERASVASTVGTEYSLEDIDEALKNDGDETKKVAPDVLVGTPSASESTDELAMFVQQDASRIERIKKRYQPENATEEDDEHDDYGFNRRPSVRGIKPRFGSTTEILQQIQSQLQPPGNPQPTTQQRHPNHMWPYYSETGLENPKSRTCPQVYSHAQYSFPTEDLKSRTVSPQYRPTSLIEENIYQNCSTQRCGQVYYGPNVNHVHQPVMRIGGGCSDFYQTLPNRKRTGRPESPPPMEMSRSYQQTMVLIPYNRIEGYQSGNVSPNPLYSTPEQCNYARFATTKKVPPNTVNKQYPEPIYHGTLPARLRHAPHMEDPQYQLKLAPKQMIRVPYSTGQPVQVHLMTSRSESPLPGQFATARATQTPSATLTTCNYYNPGPPNSRYRPAIGPVVPHNGTLWLAENPYGTKINRHSFPAGAPRYPVPDNISLADSDSQHSVQLPNGYRQPMETTFPARETSAPTSPTKTRFTERGVPEGAASVSPQDSTTTTSTMTSPTSPQNPPTTTASANGKSLYYAMNV